MLHPNYSFDRYLGANTPVSLKGFTTAPKLSVTPGKAAGITVSSPKVTTAYGTYSYGEDLTTPVTLPGTTATGQAATSGAFGTSYTGLLHPTTTPGGSTALPKPTLTFQGTQVTKPLIKTTNPKNNKKITTLGWVGIAAATLILGYVVLKPKKRKARRR